MFIGTIVYEMDSTPAGVVRRSILSRSIVSIHSPPYCHKSLVRLSFQEKDDGREKVY